MPTRSVTLADGAGDRRADLGGGAVPVTGLAEAAGLAVENGIAVDRCIQTNITGNCLVSARNLWRATGAAGILARCSQGSLAAKRTPRSRSRCRQSLVGSASRTSPSIAGAGGRRRAACPPRRATAPSSCSISRRMGGCLLRAASSGNAVARNIRLAEMLIAKGARPNAAALSVVKLKSLLAG